MPSSYIQVANMPQQTSLKLDKLDPREQTSDSLLEQKDIFQPFHTEDPERKLSFPKYRIKTSATISDDCKTWSFKQNVSRGSISTYLSQPYHCFTRILFQLTQSKAFVHMCAQKQLLSQAIA